MTFLFDYPLGLKKIPKNPLLPLLLFILLFGDIDCPDNKFNSFTEITSVFTFLKALTFSIFPIFSTFSVADNEPMVNVVPITVVNSNFEMFLTINPSIFYYHVIFCDKEVYYRRLDFLDTLGFLDIID